MKPEIKKQWIEALRSGEYTQTNMRLKTDEGYCCLGVLCDLHRKTHPELNLTWTKNDTQDSYFYDDSNVMLHKTVQEWADIDSHGRYGNKINDSINEFALTKDNDAGKSFNEIADIIEKEF